MNNRVEYLFNEFVRGNNSYKERPSFFERVFGKTSYSQAELREDYENGVRSGIWVGLEHSSLDGQIIELNKNTTNEKHKEFLEKLFELCYEYNCAVQYDYLLGMTVIDRDYGRKEIF